MAFTALTVTVLSCMISLIISIIAGHYSGRSQVTSMLESLVMLAIVIPIATIILSIPLYNLVTLNDWPNNAYVLPPQIAIWITAVLGGFLGLRSGMIWNQGDASCVYCLLSLASVLAVISFVVVVIL